MAQIRVTGVKAIIVLLLIVGFGGYRFVSARDALDTEGREELSRWLTGEYASRYLRNIDPDNITAEDAQDLLSLEKLEIVSIKGRGPRDGMVVRAEIQVDGKAPPDGRPVRYWKMRYSTLTGWRMVRESNTLLYYLNLF